MGKFGLQTTDLKVPCQSFQCHERAAYTLGKDDAPRGTEYIICEKCANELIENVMNSVKIVKPPEELPFEDHPDMFKDKKVIDWTVAELKEMATSLGVTGVSKYNKAELMHVIEEKENE